MSAAGTGSTVPLHNFIESYIVLAERRIDPTGDCRTGVRTGSQ